MLLTSGLSLTKHQGARIAKAPLFWASSVFLYKHLRKHEGIIHVHGGLPFIHTRWHWINRLTRFNAHAFKQRTVFTFQSILPHARRILETDYIGHFTSVNRELSEELGILHIPNGVDTAFFHPAELSRRSEKLHILFPARIEPLKRQLEFLQAIAELKDRVRITFAGYIADAAYGQDVIRYAEEKGFEYQIKAFGYFDMPQAYRNADVVVLFSTTEGSPLSMLEAMATGKPFIGPDLSGLADVVDHGKNGFLVKTAHDLKRCVAALLEDEELRKTIGLHARQASLEYDWSRIAKRYDKLYQEMLE